MRTLSEKVIIAGVGPGAPDLISEKAKRMIEESDVLIGGKRNLDSFAPEGKEKIEITNNLSSILEYIQKNKKKKRIVVLASGDPYLFGIGSYLYKNMGESQVETIPGISAMQYLCAKTGESYQDLFLCSVHGREQNLSFILEKHNKIGLFLGKKIETVLNLLLDMNLENAQVIIGENLSYSEEKISKGTVKELIQKKFSDLTVMIIKKENLKKKWNFTTSGITDDEFTRGKVPMTKEEIRAISLAKLKLKEDSVVWDIGAGTGSVTVECALMVPRGKVTAFEKNTEAVALIQKNCMEFGLQNVIIIEGKIEETIENQELSCDRVFLGGSGQIDFILGKLSNKQNIRIVINSVTLETTYEAMKQLDQYGYQKIECISVNLSKSVPAGTKHRMQALNTVMIISGEKGKI